ncbi:MAG: MotA/TolQ/ExbB proton channel family protein [Cyclobacteriaceae bacterium]|jgi:flagellar motor component MotA|nr:MotA/TolQ/ExbB proton channel family protein [Cyclobacteriaceae bacterium]
MLAFNFFSHQIEGGVYFMAPITILFFINMILFIYIFVKKTFESGLVEIFKHVGLLIFGYGMFGTLMGFIQMFDALEAMKETLPLSIISGGVKVALLNVLYGAGYFFIIQACYILLRALALKKLIE